MKKQKVLKTAQYIFFLALAVVLVLFAFKDVSLNDIADDLKKANYLWVLASLIIAVVSHLSRTARWNLLIEPLGYKPHFRNTFMSLMFGYFANYAFPRIGEFTRCASLGKKENIPVDKLFGTVIIERVADLTSLLLIVFMLIVFRLEFFGKFFHDNVYSPISVKIIKLFDLSYAFYISAALIFIASIVLIVVFWNKIKRFKIYTKVKDLTKNVVSGIATIYKMKRFWEFIFHTLIVWLTYIGMTYTLFFTIPETSSLKIVDALFILVAGGLAISAPVQASGLGAYHWIVAMALTIYGIEYSTGIAWATISHTSMTLLYLVFGPLSIFGLSAWKGKGIKIKNETKQNN